MRDEERSTLDHYEARASDFWLGTRDHDVTQNYDALLDALRAQGIEKPRILDFGCGPGRDLVALAARGAEVVGLDGCAAFVQMAKALSGATPVLHQTFLSLDLPPSSFDGIFANASLFHIPKADMPRVFGQLRTCLKPGGILFCSNPRAMDGESEGYSSAIGQGRYATYLTIEGWQQTLRSAGFTLVKHYLRPSNKPEHEQPWLAMVWRSTPA